MNMSMNFNNYRNLFKNYHDLTGMPTSKRHLDSLRGNRQRAKIVLDRQETQQQRPKLPPVIHSTKGTSSGGSNKNTSYKNIQTNQSYQDHIIIIIYPLTARVVPAPQIISQPVSSIKITPLSNNHTHTHKKQAKKKKIRT